MSKRTHVSNPSRSAFIGLLFFLPFLFLNTIVANRIEPVFSFIRSGEKTSSFEMILLVVMLLLIPLGAAIALRPIFKQKNFYLLNGIVGILLLFIFIVITFGFSSEIYRCEILRIPNCD